jgi:hypothetical protein
MLPACWKNNRLKKSVVQIYTKNSQQKWLVKKWLYTKKISIWEWLKVLALTVFPSRSNFWVNKYVPFGSSTEDSREVLFYENPGEKWVYILTLIKNHPKKFTMLVLVLRSKIPQGYMTVLNLKCEHLRIGQVKKLPGYQYQSGFFLLHCKKCLIDFSVLPNGILDFTQESR